MWSLNGLPLKSIPWFSVSGNSKKGIYNHLWDLGTRPSLWSMMRNHYQSISEHSGSWQKRSLCWYPMCVSGALLWFCQTFHFQATAWNNFLQHSIAVVGCCGIFGTVSCICQGTALQRDGIWRSTVDDYRVGSSHDCWNTTTTCNCSGGTHSHQQSVESAWGTTLSPLWILGVGSAWPPHFFGRVLSSSSWSVLCG